MTRPVLAPEDLRGALTPGQLAIGGDRVVYTLRSAEQTELWTVDYSGGKPRRLVEHGH